MLKIIGIFFFFFLLNSSECVNRTYLIKKDLISGLKGGEFTIYDAEGKKALYRMESKLGALHHVRLFEGLTKKNPIGLLKSKISVVLYKGNIAILNKKSNQWNNGTLNQNYKIVGNKFVLNFNSNDIVMEGKAASFDTTFIDQSTKEILAKFRKRISSLFWKNKYDLQVLSNKFPDEVYFLAVAARDHTNKKIHSG
ncbi:hypothetical protein I4U23_031313 [Adineta vaga]|nr:hypothetical protein I4U23_031313 [Adineta vaga]